jgi:deoxyribonuclease-4
VQIFSHSPRQWKKTLIAGDEAERFINLRRQYDIKPVFIHASYLINLASGSKELREKSTDLLAFELDTANLLGAEYVVLHPGSASGQRPADAVRRVGRALKKAVSGYTEGALILIENTAGQRGDISSSVRALRDIFDACHGEGIGGICIDTCHAFACGYDITAGDGTQRLLDEIEDYFGIDMLRLIHLNDSKKPCGSRVDRHEHIGTGFIGTSGFREFLSAPRLSGVPLILETPKNSEDDDRRNLGMVRKILNSHKSAADDRFKT